MKQFFKVSFLAFVIIWICAICSILKANIVYHTINGIKTEICFKDTTNWIKHKPYKTRAEFSRYFWPIAESFELKYPYIKAEFIIAKCWMETNGGLKGVGQRGAYFGIKGKGLKGFDPVDNENVEYQSYNNRWDMINHFCEFISKPLYMKRYSAWKDLLPNESDAIIMSLALQVHPKRKYSKLAYAMCGCKDGRKLKCYETRINTAWITAKLTQKVLEDIK